jgi:AcrR family transcriptional regulator
MNTMSTQKRKYELKARAEGQRQTRQRIVEATMQLHEEVGPARTTVAEVARRAGVQRLTVYNHFPEDEDLFRACGGHWTSLHPVPDVSPALATEDPQARVQQVLSAFYGWYRANESMIVPIQRDRNLIPALDKVVTETTDEPLRQLADALARGFDERARSVASRRALIRLALDFWSWRSLAMEGLDDQRAAHLMANAIARTSKTEV